MIEILEARTLLSTSWYVAANGNDHNAGTLAAPFQTIQHAAGLARPGDAVLIRGGTYHEKVTPARSGTAAAPITYQAYNNEVVTVSGADAITSWSLNGGSVYKSPNTFTVGVGFNQVFVDGTAMTEARWPNTGPDLLHPTLGTISSVSQSITPFGSLYSATATFKVTNLPGGVDAWKGATIQFGSGQDWLYQSGAVVASDVGSITIAYQHYSRWETPVAGNHFYLTDSFRALDAAGEWYRDPNTHTLYLWTPAGDSPSKHDVEAKRRQFAFELSDRSYINLSGIRIFAATIDSNANSNHLTLDKLNVAYVSNQLLKPLAWDRHNTSSRTGIILDGSNNVLSNSTIAFSSGCGVRMTGSNNSILNCTIHDVDTAGGGEAAIGVTGSNQTILNNLIYNTGRDGIALSQAYSSTVNHNTIHDIGLLTTDLGAIYMHGGIGKGTEIAFNTISNVKTGGYGGVGVYLDNGSTGYIIHDNKISNTNQAIKSNPPTYGNQIYNNALTFGVQVNTPTFGPQTYTSDSANLAVLGTLGGYSTTAIAINAAGTIVGGSNSGSTNPAIIDTNLTMSSLGTLGGADSTAASINNTGQIAGSALDANGVRQAFLYSTGKMTSLGQLSGDSYSIGAGINASGQVVGTSIGPTGIGHAFLYSGGTMKALGTLGGSLSQAFAINDAGTIVGSSTVAGDKNAHAFSYSAGTMTDLGTLGGSSSYALAISQNGAIVGESMIKGDVAMHAFVYANGKMTDIGVFAGYQSSRATAINSNGDIVGFCYTVGTKSPRGFLYRNGKMYDLTTMLPAGSGWTITQPYAINDTGQIAGATTDADSNQRAFILSVVTG
ncbi:MAG TPA: right-handed parallel beta-helix repeat-containing protein [Humisphaera sp.]|jgi:probable HAF family extracellular repeat protein|nr:right-handed parallel beta-helix repeat-containing protein [Humisphaera sp.]